ncbi:histidine phosphatase family protein [Roseburia sp. AM51-8]|jgi:alpha-ribazole phosphatase|uniref:histidine phosphatase family protein n=1 Tax=unclassified Roseburia TaxID=2637578 RepID=UPI000E4E9DA1|nr:MULTISPECIES: histidine phosphatase family protein [unclassified Roseburia]RHO31974.1 histidine phosphatase family protein [Roseburia sp. AM16-25]RHQ02305.1 histidine phosphatase family protein [Roseburia sp. AM51-8]
MSDTTTNQVEIVLIRHGKTEGNKEKRYIGRTDQPLSEEGIAGIKENLGRYPSVEKVYASPMKRTRQTAELIYPGQASELVDGLREMDMGVFEGKNHAELKNRPSYILWVATRGKISIPGGESMKDFGKRTMDAFTQVLGDMQAEGIKRSAVVAHGGTIMSIVSQLADDDYYKYMVNNGAGFRLTLDDDGKLLDLKPLLKEDNCMQDALEELED